MCIILSIVVKHPTLIIKYVKSWHCWGTYFVDKVYGLLKMGLRSLNEGLLNLGTLNKGRVGGKFCKSLGGRGWPVTARCKNERTGRGACLHHGTIKGLKTDLGSSGGKGQTIPSINTTAATRVTRQSLVTLSPFAIFLCENKNVLEK